MNSLWTIEDRLELLTVFNRFVANSLPVADVLEEKLAYGSHPQQYLVLCLPKNPALRRRSAVYFLHGGGWNSGNPSLFRFVGHFFARKGYPTLLGGYRLAPGSRFPAQLEDASAGLESGLRALASRGVPVDRVMIGGHSAGAHLASLLVYDRELAGRGKMSLSQTRGFFGISGPLNFSFCTNAPMQKMLTDLLGANTGWGRANPIQLLQGDEQLPALLIHGQRDPLVDVQNSITFAAALAESRTCPVEVHLVRRGHHADLLRIFLKNTQATRVLTAWLGQWDKP